MRQAFVSFFSLFLLLAAGCSPSAEDGGKGPLVLAASSLQEAMEAAADEWVAQGHDRPVLSFAASSALAHQVEAGAPGDLFVSADQEWMDEVESKGLLAAGSRAIFLGNRLVLVAPKDRPVSIELKKGFSLTLTLGDGRLAMADPEAVPAGRYGREALETLGAWDAVAGRIASVENVRVALALVSRGEAPLGIVYATDAKAEPAVVVAGTFPETSHKQIVYPIARLASSTDPEAADFLRFLTGDEGRAVFRKFGFTTP